MSTDKFFSKENIYPTIWAIVVGLLAFIGGLIWRNWTGPDEIVVLNKGDNNKDTTVTIIQFQPDQKYFEELSKLTSKNTTKRLPSADKSKTKKSVDSIALAIAKEYQSKFDSLSLTFKNSEEKRLTDNLESIPTIESNSGFIGVKRPKFKMPSIVEGYMQGKINSYASFTLNSYEFKRNEMLKIKIDFFNQATINKMTPLHVDLVEPKSGNSVYFIWGEQYEIKNLKNELTFSADFGPGKYQLTVGFYFVNEVEQKYPTLYSKKFNIEIK